MNIVIANMSLIPVYAYGGTERVIWDLGKKLVEAGHKVTFLVPQGSTCDFADVIEITPNWTWEQQVPENTDIIHFQFQPHTQEINIPVVVTEHGNAALHHPLHLNTIFLSRNHAERHGSSCYVYNGLDWENYGDVDFLAKRDYFHFLGKAAWRLKNVKGAIDIAKRLDDPLFVLGGDRFNFKRGIRLTFTQKAKFFGMVGGQEKLSLLNHSKGLIFPVRWHEPFGLAIIESLYFGCPVFSTPYGAIPELVPATCGFLSNAANDLIEVIKGKNSFEQEVCHLHAKQYFNAQIMMENYLEQYKKVISGQSLNRDKPWLKNEAERLSWRPFTKQ